MEVLLGVVVLVPLALVLRQAVARLRDRRRFPPPGRLVDVGGYRLHVTVEGEGTPTVVLVQGLSGMGLGFGEVARLIAPFARVVTYDRASAGWSDSRRGTRTCLDMAAELRTLLDRAGIEPPYVLVGMSLGGHIVRLFAATYPDDVAGLVLVDVTNEDTPIAVRGSVLRGDVVSRAFALLSSRRTARVLAGLGVVGAAIALRRPHVLQDLLEAVPDGMRPAFVALANRRDFVDALADEMAGVPQSQEQVKRTWDEIPDVPVAVVSAAFRGIVARRDWSNGLREQSRAEVDRLGDALARLTSRGRHVVVDDSDHMVPLRRPDAVADAVRWVVEAAPGHDRRPSRPMKALDHLLPDRADADTARFGRSLEAPGITRGPDFKAILRRHGVTHGAQRRWHEDGADVHATVFAFADEAAARRAAAELAAPLTAAARDEDTLTANWDGTTLDVESSRGTRRLAVVTRVSGPYLFEFRVQAGDERAAAIARRLAER